MENYKDYFRGWITNCDKEYVELKNLNDMANADFDNRFKDSLSARANDAGSINSPQTAPSDKIQKGIPEGLDSFTKSLNNFTNNLEILEKNWNSYQKSDGLRKMAHLTKSHLLLREGQYRGEHFLDPQGQYQQACILLEQEYEPGKADFLNLMLQLHLGKYFCATARHNQRSDYLRALDEFSEIRRTIEGSANHRLTLWQTHIWLEANIQLGSTLRHLYRLREAKLCFLHLLVQLARLHPDHISINPQLDRYIANAQLPVDMTQRLNGTFSIYDGYLVETLVQLGIAYQKSRDYDIAQDICVAILKKDPDNIDAANNLGICLRKQGVMTSFWDYAREKGIPVSDRMNSVYFRQKYQDIFTDLGKRGNRFARLHSIKCQMYDNSSDKDALRQELQDMLKGNPNDHEVCLLQGLLLQAEGELEDSQKKLIDLYKKASRISKGTIGLKAYYNIADNLLRQGKFHDAKMFYKKIQEECTKPDSYCLAKNEEDSNFSLAQPLRLEDLPPGDLLAEINEGWCFMNLGDYESARDCYEAILSRYEKLPHRLIHMNKMKIYNNLGECLLHLASCQDDSRLLDEAGRILNLVYTEEKCNSTANRHLGYYHQLLSRRSIAWKQNIRQALMHFEQAQLYDASDVYAHAGWVSVATEALQKEADFSPEERADLIYRIENKLKYSSGSYPIKSCAKFASFIEKMEKANKAQHYGDDRLDTMYRSLARIRLSEKDEGYGQFLHFMEDDVFRRLEAKKRGRLLVALFRLYEQIIRIKDLCRFAPKTNGSDKEFLIPVHYTKLSTLKLLLGDNPAAPGKLRLWNTVYMNDSFEGECFIELMELAGKKRVGLDNQDGSVRERMKRYFPYLGRQHSRNDSLAPINKNIYVTSFSEQINDIYMWVPYGDDAKGCAITFSDDFFDIRKSRDKLTDVSSYSDMDYPLYKIQYLDERTLELLKEGKYDQISQPDDATRNILQILEIMDNIWETIYDLERRMDEGDPSDTKDGSAADSLRETNLIQNFVAGCLNEVRFLIKDSEYAHEGEIRMFHYSYEPQIDTKNFVIPRLYVDVDRRIQIKEVKLGSKISEAQANEIVSWLTKTNAVERITKSQRHYK